ANGRVLVNAVFVFQQVGRNDSDGAAGDCGFIRLAHVVHFQGNVLNAVAVQDEPLRLRMLRAKRRRQYKGNVTLLEDVASLMPRARLQTGVSDHVETEGIAIEIRRLPSVADEEAHVIDAAKGNVRLAHG